MPEGGKAMLRFATLCAARRCVVALISTGNWAASSVSARLWDRPWQTASSKTERREVGRTAVSYCMQRNMRGLGACVAIKLRMSANAQRCSSAQVH